MMQQVVQLKLRIRSWCTEQQHSSNEFGTPGQGAFANVWCNRTSVSTLPSRISVDSRKMGLRIWPQQIRAPEGDDGGAKAGDDGNEGAEYHTRDACHLQISDLGHQPRVLAACRQLYCDGYVCVPRPPECDLPAIPPQPLCWNTQSTMQLRG